MTDQFKQTLLAVLRDVHKNPGSLLGTAPAEILERLQTQANSKAQGTGNKVTNQEACFAVVLERHGFRFRDKFRSEPLSDGLYYIYQLKGSQQAGDFAVEEVCQGHTTLKVLDLKHTLTKIFYFNDGWFSKDVIYVISWNAGTAKRPVPRVHIGLGQHIPTAEENEAMRQAVAFKQAKNSTTSRVGSLYFYVRFANRYGCERFTEEADVTQLRLTEEWILSLSK